MVVDALVSSVSKNAENCDPNVGAGHAAPPPPPPPPPPPSQTTPSGEDMRSGLDYIMSWAERDVEVLKQIRGNDVLRRIARNIKVSTYSTASSGIDAPGTALRLLVDTISDMTGAPLDCPEHVSAWEIDDACRRELLLHPSKPTCLYSDLTEVWEPHVGKKIRNLVDTGFAIPLDDLIPLIKSKKATRRFAQCVCHSRQCPIRTARVHVAGLPCTDWSPQGLRKRGAGGTILIFAAWACVRLQTQDHIIVHENAESFDPELLKQVFEDQYIVQSMILRPPERGLPQRRNRRWSIMIHRKLVLETVTSLANVYPLFKYQPDFTWQVLLCADASELLHELRWAARESNPKRASSRWPAGVEVSLDVPDAFEKSLSEFELNNLFEYTKRAEPATVHHLSQNPKDFVSVRPKLESYHQPPPPPTIHPPSTHHLPPSTHHPPTIHPPSTHHSPTIHPPSTRHPPTHSHHTNNASLSTLDSISVLLPILGSGSVLTESFSKGIDFQRQRRLPFNPHVLVGLSTTTSGSLSSLVQQPARAGNVAACASVFAGARAELDHGLPMHHHQERVDVLVFATPPLDGGKRAPCGTRTLGGPSAGRFLLSWLAG